MTVPEKQKDTSDPVSYVCSCDARNQGGSVLLFYRYWDNEPQLPHGANSSKDLNALAEFHRSLSSSLSLGGKFRIANEGFNITLGGTTSSISSYISECVNHWSFAGLNLSTKQAQDAYFKPTPGCGCAFGGKAAVKVTAEITPLGITNYTPSSWSKVTSLPPEDFHRLCQEGSVPLIDCRNHYESRIGYFTTGNGGAAVRPAVRRFSQWPGYVMRHVLGKEQYKQPTGVATYCTGGIRCEKGARWMQETLAADGDLGDAPVYTLQGGIVAYQAWMQQEVEAGRRRPEDSFFKGRNYVFDARGSIHTNHDSIEKVSACHGCGTPDDRLSKCKSSNCHLVLVVCESCDVRGTSCCDDCEHADLLQGRAGISRAHRMCECESNREKALWGDGKATLSTPRRQQKSKAMSKN